MQQRPIFPDRLQSSIVGAGELNFCVRYENRWDLTANVTAMVYNQLALDISCSVYILYTFFLIPVNFFSQWIHNCIALFTSSSLGSAKSLIQLVSYTIKFVFLLNLLRSSPRPISIGQLNTLLYLHPRPINLIVFEGSYYLMIWDILS